MTFPLKPGHLLLTPLSSDPPQQLAPIVAHALGSRGFRFAPRLAQRGRREFHRHSLDRLHRRPHRRHGEPQRRPRRARSRRAGQPRPGSRRRSAPRRQPRLLPHQGHLRSLDAPQLVGDKVLAAALKAYVPSARIPTPATSSVCSSNPARPTCTGFSRTGSTRTAACLIFPSAASTPTPSRTSNILVAVDIVNDGYAEATVPLTLVGGGTSATAWVHVPAHGSVTHRMLFQQAPTEVDLNDGSIPEVQSSTHQKTVNAPPPQ